FSGQRDFGTAAQPTPLTSTGTADIYLAKYSPTGELQWAKDFAGSSKSVSQGNAVAVDGDGNIFVTGLFQGTVDFHAVPGVAQVTSAGGSDIFAAKFDAAGNLLWVRSAGGTSDDMGNDLAVDPTGNVWIAGAFQGSVDFDPSAATSLRTSAGDNDAVAWE